MKTPESNLGAAFLGIVDGMREGASRPINRKAWLAALALGTACGVVASAYDIKAGVILFIVSFIAITAASVLVE